MNMFENFERGLVYLFDEDNYGMAMAMLANAEGQARAAAKEAPTYYDAAPYYQMTGLITSVQTFAPYIDTALVPNKSVSLAHLRKQAAHIQSVLRPF